MKTLKYFLVSLLLTFSIVGCDKGFEEMNQDPNNPIAIPSELLITDIVRSAGNQLYSTFFGDDMGECWAGHVAKVQYNDEERYSIRQNVVDGAWNVFYEIVVSDSRTMELLAKTEGNEVVQGIALVMQSYGYLIITDSWGNIPCTEAMRADEGILSPVYDSQEVVYDSVFAKLDRADVLLQGTGSMSSTFDLLYGGDVTKWRKFANSLKFRALMRISGVKDVSAELTALMSKPMFTSNSDEAKLVFLSEQPNANPRYESIVYGAREEYKMNEEIVNTLVAMSDPRLEIYAQKNTDGDYRGKPAGVADVPSDLYSYNNVSPIGEFYLLPEAPAYFLSYAELCFLKAEAVQKGYISGTVATFYNEGIAANMLANVVEDALTTTYISDEAIVSGTELEQIALQKWIALFGQGHESWTEYRRVKMPVLPYSIDAVFNEIPSRYPYPSIEQSINATNYNAAIGVQGADLMTTKIWWIN